MKNLPDFSNMDMFIQNSGVGFYPTPDNFLQKLLDIKYQYSVPSPNIKFNRNDYDREDTLNIKRSVDGEIKSNLIKHNTYSPHHVDDYKYEPYKTYEYISPFYDNLPIIKVRNCE